VLFLVLFSLFTVSDVLGLALILGSFFILIPGLFIFRQSLFWFLAWNYLALSVEFLVCNLLVGYFSFGFIMSSERLDSFHIRFNGKYCFNGKNYSAWEFQFQLFVKGKELWGHINGSNPAPNDVDALSKWEIMDARVMSWILSSIEPHLILNLRPYKTAATMWNYLNKVYNQDNTARRFQLEYEMANFTQGSLSIEEYFSGFQNLWANYLDIVYANVPAAALSAVQAVHETSKRDQFLMKLRSDFETARSNLMNRHPVPSLDACLSELLREE